MKVVVIHLALTGDRALGLFKAALQENGVLFAKGLQIKVKKPPTY